MNMRPSSTRGGGWLAVLAFAGLLLGHFMAYVVIAPDEGVRAAILEATGHRGHNLFVPVGGAALLAAIIGMVSRQLRRDRTADDPGASPVRIGCTLWILQSVAFGALEAFERLTSAHVITELIHEPAFLVGLVLQAAVALLGVALVFLLRATVAALRGRASRDAAGGAVTPLRPESVAVVPLSLARSAWNLRGPPVPSNT